MQEILDRDTILNFFEDHKKEIGELGVKSIGLFGSFVRNEQKDNSDIDILVDYKTGEKTFKNFMQLVHFLEASLNREVELVTKEALSKYIGPHIEKEIQYVSIAD